MLLDSYHASQKSRTFPGWGKTLVGTSLFGGHSVLEEVGVPFCYQPADGMTVWAMMVPRCGH